MQRQFILTRLAFSYSEPSPNDDDKLMVAFAKVAKVRVYFLCSSVMVNVQKCGLSSLNLMKMQLNAVCKKVVACKGVNTSNLVKH